MQLYQPQSFYETTLTESIDATSTTIKVASAPTVTEGYLVIDHDNSLREIVKYTGVSGLNLTGCIRGLAYYGSNDGAGTGLAHSSGANIANRNVHFYSTGYYTALVGTSATGGNNFRVGDGSAVSTTARRFYAQTSSVSAFLEFSTGGHWGYSDDGTTVTTLSAIVAGTGISAVGLGLDLAGNTVAVDFTETQEKVIWGDGLTNSGVSAAIDLLSTSNLRISATKLAIDDATGSVTAATSGASGKVELATAAETQTGTDLTRAVTPSGLSAWAGTANITSVGTLTVGNVDAAVTTATSGAAGKVELATAAETQTGTALNRALTPSGLSAWAGTANITAVGTLTTGNVDAAVTAATSGAAGKIELATAAETQTGTALDRAVTPSGLSAWAGTANITNVGAITAVIAGQPHCYDACIVYPASASDKVIIGHTLEAITVTGLSASTDSTSYEAVGDVKWADDIISFTNATVINDFDTTSGVRVDTSITAGSVAKGKWVYLDFDSMPSSAMTYMAVHVNWDYN